MNRKLIDLYESKIEKYEQIIGKIKEANIALLVDFEDEFCEIDTLNSQIDETIALSTLSVLTIKL